MKAKALCGVVGAVGSGIAYLLGGWDESVRTLVLFMAIDYVSGLAVAGIFHKSQKTKSGALESKTCWTGLVKKVMTLAMVVVANYLDLTTGQNYFRDAVCIAFIVNESISIVENAGLMGVPIPKKLTAAIELLNSKGDAAHE